MFDTTDSVSIGYELHCDLHIITMTNYFMVMVTYSQRTEPLGLLADEDIKSKREKNRMNSRNRQLLNSAVNPLNSFQKGQQSWPTPRKRLPPPLTILSWTIRRVSWKTWSTGHIPFIYTSKVQKCDSSCVSAVYIWCSHGTNCSDVSRTANKTLSIYDEISFNCNGRDRHTHSFGIKNGTHKQSFVLAPTFGSDHTENYRPKIW